MQKGRLCTTWLEIYLKEKPFLLRTNSTEKIFYSVFSVGLSLYKMVGNLPERKTLAKTDFAYFGASHATKGGRVCTNWWEIYRKEKPLQSRKIYFGALRGIDR